MSILDKLNNFAAKSEELASKLEAKTAVMAENAKKYVAKIEELIGVSVDMVSVGPNRAQTIVRRNVF